MEYPNGDYRDWGFGNWWQNTRLPYGAMVHIPIFATQITVHMYSNPSQVAAGDFDSMRVILDYYMNMCAHLTSLPPTKRRLISLLRDLKHPSPC